MARTSSLWPPCRDAGGCRRITRTSGEGGNRSGQTQARSAPEVSHGPAPRDAVFRTWPVGEQPAGDLRRQRGAPDATAVVEDDDAVAEEEPALLAVVGDDHRSSRVGGVGGGTPRGVLAGHRCHLLATNLSPYNDGNRGR